MKENKLEKLFPSIFACFVVSFIMIGIVATLPNNKTVKAKKDDSSSITSGSQEEVIKTEIIREDINFEIVTIEDNSLEYGKTIVRETGSKGVRARYFEVTYKNNTEIKRKETKTIIEKEPVDEIILKGTKILWHCTDVTSFDGNQYNDNKCTSSTGEVRYLSDSKAVALDPNYRPGKSGTWYYNNK